MSNHYNDLRHLSDSEIFEDESESFQSWEEEYGDSISKSAKKAMIRKRIEERLEKKRLRHELDDYDEEIYEEFDWGD